MVSVRIILTSCFLFLPADTVSDEQAFRVYLGNIPADVVLEEVRINGSPLLSDAPERGISPVVHVNGSRAYELRLPFEDSAVQWTVKTDRTSLTSDLGLVFSGKCMIITVLTVLITAFNWS